MGGPTACCRVSFNFLLQKLAEANEHKNETKILLVTNIVMVLRQ